MKWWFISDENVQKIKEGLLAPTHEDNDFNCPDNSVDDECESCKGNELRREALRCLESGLQSTEGRK